MIVILNISPLEFETWILGFGIWILALGIFRTCNDSLIDTQFEITVNQFIRL